MHGKISMCALKYSTPENLRRLARWLQLHNVDEREHDNLCDAVHFRLQLPAIWDDEEPTRSS